MRSVKLFSLWNIFWNWFFFLKRMCIPSSCSIIKLEYKIIASHFIFNSDRETELDGIQFYQLQLILVFNTHHTQLYDATNRWHSEILFRYNRHMVRFSTQAVRFCGCCWSERLFKEVNWNSGTLTIHKRSTQAYFLAVKLIEFTSFFLFYLENNDIFAINLIAWLESWAIIKMKRFKIAFKIDFN